MPCPEYHFYELPIANPRVQKSWPLDRDRFQQILTRALEWLPLPADGTVIRAAHFYRFNEIVIDGEKMNYTFAWLHVRSISVAEDGWCIRLGGVSTEEGRNAFRNEVIAGRA
jgi:hypothetical protein